MQKFLRSSGKFILKRISDSSLNNLHCNIPFLFHSLTPNLVKVATNNYRF